jgi:hypothetical protein
LDILLQDERHHKEPQTRQKEQDVPGGRKGGYVKKGCHTVKEGTMEGREEDKGRKQGMREGSKEGRKDGRHGRKDYIKEGGKERTD